MTITTLDAPTRVQESRRRFLTELARGPKVISDAYLAWQQCERQAFEARRARREAEVLE